MIRHSQFKCQCGCENYVKRQSCRGVWESTHDAVGNVVNTDLSEMAYGREPQRVACANCGKRHPSPALAAAEPETRKDGER